LIDWCLTPTLTVFQLYRDFFNMRKFGVNKYSSITLQEFFRNDNLSDNEFRHRPSY